MEILKWQKLASKYLVKERWATLRVDTCKLQNGSVKDDYYVLEYPNWVNAIALTKENKVIMVRQYRFAADIISLEIPGGVIDEGEEPEMGGEEVAPESEDSDLGEENDLSMDALEELINTPFEDMDEEDETFDDYGMESMSNDDEDGFGDFDFNFEINEEDPIGDSEPEQDEIKELDINELTDVINQSVKEALGKYIK